MKDNEGLRTCVIAESDEGFEFDLSVSPERALSSAVLFDAVQNLLCFDRATKDGKKYIEQTFEWVYNQGDDYPFSFFNVCDALALDPKSLRLGIVNAYNSGGVFH